MIRLLSLAFVFAATAALALDPSEMLPDPELEARARALDNELRCVKCQSESLASSNADWARDARRAVRELISAGATDEEVKDWFLERYGEFVLMTPSTGGANLVLWIAGPVMLLAALGIGGAYVLRRRSAPASEEAPLSAEDEARLEALLKD